MKIIHIITGLNTGGAEMMLFKLLSAFDKKNAHIVISLMDGGPIKNLIDDINIPVYCLGMKRGIPSLKSIFVLRKIVQDFAPDIVQGWMYHGNLTAQIARFFSRKPVKIVWNIRQSVETLNKERFLTKWVIRINAFLSKNADLVLYNSNVSLLQHSNLGFFKKNSFVIPNGFDSERYKPSKESYDSFRRVLKIPSNSILIGLIARFHPMKNHNLFLQAASLLLMHRKDVYFILVGKNVDESNIVIQKKIAELGIQNNVFLLGEQKNVAHIIASLDISTSTSSWGEAFPNVIGESMSCGVPCVATDVGDSSIVIGKTGISVPTNNAEMVLKAWENLISLGQLERCKLGLLARQRVLEEYSLLSVVEKYEKTYSMLVNKN